jgi:hypothetical protein
VIAVQTRVVFGDPAIVTARLAQSSEVVKKLAKAVLTP